MSNENKTLEEAIAGLSEEDLQSIAAAGDMDPEASPAVILAVTAIGNLGLGIYNTFK